MNKNLKRVLITGGGGYVGSALVPKLLQKGYRVTVLDLFLYGEKALGDVKEDSNLTLIKGDVRDTQLLEKTITGMDAVIHLACISNDPSYELNPILGKSINYDAFLPLVDISKAKRVKRFIYASSSSVYGIKKEKEVTEELALEPLTDYSKYKALCENYLQKNATKEFVVTTVRPATVCGYSPRTRLDLTVNILTNHAINKGKITVFGGEQKRPNLHIEDMTNVYLFLLEQADSDINRKIYNVGYENFKVKEIAHKIKKAVGADVPIETTHTDDIRSYHVSSEKIKRELGFVAKHTIEEAVTDLAAAFVKGKLPNSLDDKIYFNIKMMQSISLS